MGHTSKMQGKMQGKMQAKMQAKVQARLFQPDKPATQSGTARMGSWVLEYLPKTPKRPEALMGWTSAGDTSGQVRMSFPSKEAALRYADSVGLNVELQTLPARRKRPNNYTMNFRPDLVRP